MKTFAWLSTLAPTSFEKKTQYSSPSTPPLLNLILHKPFQHLSQPLIPPAQQHHILDLHDRPARMFRETLEIQGGGADLRPDQLHQGADELRGGVDVVLESFVVDDLADGVPEGGFEALSRVLAGRWQLEEERYTFSRARDGSGSSVGFDMFCYSRVE